jgi:hypothetical protein
MSDRRITRDLSYEQAHEFFFYCPVTGALNWKEPTARRKNPAGRVASTGYWVVYVAGLHIYVHRIIWTMHRGRPSQGVVDHIDRVKENNRIENLRECTGVQNSYNRTVNKNSSLKVLGVRKDGERYYARIWDGRKSHFLGYFDTLEEAVSARNLVAQKFHGDFAAVAQMLTPEGVDA